MPSYLKRYISGTLFIEKMWTRERDIRNVFHMPKDKPCADFVAHQEQCPYLVGEEKERSDIPKAIKQIEFTVESLTNQGHHVIECYLLIESLAKFRSIFTSKNGYLYDKIRNSYLTIRPNIKIRIIKKSEAVKQKRKRL